MARSRENCVKRASSRRTGFTLIELSIVLVVIGLIVGGVLVGRDLISAATIRAQISQIEKYQQAANTFRVKYGYLPGDIPDPDASNFGFKQRTEAGHGDGLLGLNSSFLVGGEQGLFWSDLSAAHLIEGSFYMTDDAASMCTGASVPSDTEIARYLPEAKMGRSNYVYTWSGGWCLAGNCGDMVGEGQVYAAGDHNNYFGVSNVWGGCDVGFVNVGMTVKEAYDIDAKVDDGLPQFGVVMAMYSNPSGRDPFSGVGSVGAIGGTVDTSASNTNGGAVDASGLPVNGGNIKTPANSTTCYDNGNIVGAIEKYSITTNRGMGINCALSFKFQ